MPCKILTFLVKNTVYHSPKKSKCWPERAILLYIALAARAINVYSPRSEGLLNCRSVTTSLAFVVAECSIVIRI